MQRPEKRGRKSPLALDGLLLRAAPDFRLPQFLLTEHSARGIGSYIGTRIHSSGPSGDSRHDRAHADAQLHKSRCSRRSAGAKLGRYSGRSRPAAPGGYRFHGTQSAGGT